MHVVARRYDTIQQGRNWVWALPGARSARRSQRFAQLRFLHQKSRRENLFSRGLYLMKVYVFLRETEKNCGSCLLAASLQQNWETTLTGRETPVTNTMGSRGLSPLAGGTASPKTSLQQHWEATLTEGKPLRPIRWGQGDLVPLQGGQRPQRETPASAGVVFCMRFVICGTFPRTGSCRRGRSAPAA